MQGTRDSRKHQLLVVNSGQHMKDLCVKNMCVHVLHLHVEARDESTFAEFCGYLFNSFIVLRQCLTSKELSK